MLQRISVFGLGKVGHVLAICLADAGHQVIGMDIDKQLVNEINNGRFQSLEPGVMNRFKRVSNKRFTATNNGEEAVLQSDISLIILPTPSNALGGFSLRYVLKACQTIATALKKKKRYHLVSVMSTILPGSSDYLVMPLLEQISERNMGRNLGYCYNPIFIALGEVVKGLIEPDYLLIGQSETKAGNLVLAMYKPLIKRQPPIVRTQPIEAEITKIASNTHETMRVSFANMLCTLCESIPGTNVDRITTALAHRMGKRFFKGAVPYGGPCWPRDNLALAAFMDAIGLSSIIPRTIDQYNKDYAGFIFHRLLNMTQKGTKVGILGLAYKPGTPVIDYSFGVDLARLLTTNNRIVVVWDPLAMKEVRRVLADKVIFAKSGNDCLRQAEVLVIVNAMRELKKLRWETVTNRPVLDCWRFLSKEHHAKLNDYYPLGWGSNNKRSLVNKIGFDRLCSLTK